jgi:hypothetical protein
MKVLYLLVIALTAYNTLALPITTPPNTLTMYNQINTLASTAWTKLLPKLTQAQKDSIIAWRKLVPLVTKSRILSYSTTRVRDLLNNFIPSGMLSQNNLKILANRYTISEAID